jgi:hypothetical protein
MLTSETEIHASRPAAYAVELKDGRRRIQGDGQPAFTFRISDETQLERLLTADDFGAAAAFIRGEFDMSGDLLSAIRFKQAKSRPGWSGWL